jgi:hypothetical protein
MGVSMKIYKSIIAIMSEVGAIEKSRSGNGISYKFRGIEDVLSNFHPLLIKHNVFCAPKVIKESSETFLNKSGNNSFRVTLTIEHVFYSDDGSSVSATTTGEGIDTSDKATNKAMSAAFKYAFFELFCVPTAEVDDSDYNNPTIKGDLSKWVIPIGTNKGKTLEAVGYDKLLSAINYFMDQEKKTGKKIDGLALEYLTNAQIYINDVDSQFQESTDFESYKHR